MFNLFSNIYNLYWKHKNFFPKKQYSCFGEDIFIKEFFRNQLRGFYVDVGSYHPFFWNNTYLLYKKKWRGINIDANPLSFSLFNFARNDDYNFNFAVTNQKKKKIKFFYRRKMNVLNTTDEEFAKRNFPNGYKTLEIDCLSLDSILEKTIYKNKQIDFLNIDVENTEKDVLDSLNFQIYKPKLICVEIHIENKANLKNNPTFKFLNNKQYKVVWNKEYSYIFSAI
jgi:FkbM family methyltransferase